MFNDTFESFKTRKLSEYCGEVVVREWAPSFANEPHEHPLDTGAIVVKGEFWLTIHYKAGNSFEVARGQVQSENTAQRERFSGPQGRTDLQLRL